MTCLDAHPRAQLPCVALCFAALRLCGCPFDGSGDTPPPPAPTTDLCTGAQDSALIRAASEVDAGGLPPPFDGIYGAATLCAVGYCFDVLSMGEPGLGNCIRDCIDAQLGQPLSHECSGCYVDHVLCVFDACNEPCFMGNDFVACDACVQTECVPITEVCSGVAG